MELTFNYLDRTVCEGLELIIVLILESTDGEIVRCDRHVHNV